MFPALGGSVTGLSVTDSCRWWGGDRTNLRLRVPDPVSNIAQSWKFHECDVCQPDDGNDSWPRRLLIHCRMPGRPAGIR